MCKVAYTIFGLAASVGSDQLVYDQHHKINVQYGIYSTLSIHKPSSSAPRMP